MESGWHPEEEDDKKIPLVIQFRRWLHIIRGKAKYEHNARQYGEEVSEPSLDDICNEMEAFIDGYLSGIDTKNN